MTIIKRQFKLGVLIVTLHLLLSVASVYAETLHDIKASRLETIMKNEGYAVSINGHHVSWRINGMRTMMLISEDGRAIQFHAAFGGSKTSLQEVNEWNKTKRYSRSYIDAEEDPHLELDLDMKGGVTRDRIIDFIKTCHLSFQRWVNEVVMKIAR